MNDNLEYSQLIRKFRSNNQMTLRSMAKRMQCSAAFLSAIETGKTRIPSDWHIRLFKSCSMTKQERMNLVRAIDSSRDEIMVPVKGLKRKYLVSDLSRCINDLPDKTVDQVYGLILAGFKESKNGRAST